jgi:capsular polysaccharide export protein
MLKAARAAHPGRPIVIRGHPDSAAGHRDGHFAPAMLPVGVTFCPPDVSPWAALKAAHAVYTVSSHLGVEAIMAGHRPHVFGTPFYAGWGLTEDCRPLPRRERRLRPEQLFAAAMILYPVWYCPNRDRLCSLEAILDGMEARVAAFRQDRHGHIAVGMRRWKWRHTRHMFGGKVSFSNPSTAVRRAASSHRSLLVWASRATPELEQDAAAAGVPLLRVEDGFLRSRGLGARLVPPLSLVADDLGIHCDPTRESRLEQLIAASVSLPSDRRARAEALIQQLTARGLSKYNLGTAALPPLPSGHRILVAGQVEDDVSVLRGTGKTRTNLGLLQAARATNPGAVILYKPHPDVEAGLRRGHVPADRLAGLADRVVIGIDPAVLLDAVDELWTLTSQIGFEALLRGRSVTCLGAPFYAGWGLTTDLGPIPRRRTARPGLAGLAHAALIDYPRYFDPVSGEVCAVEVVLDRLSARTAHQGSGLLGALTSLRGKAARLTRPG